MSETRESYSADAPIQRVSPGHYCLPPDPDEEDRIAADRAAATAEGLPEWAEPHLTAAFAAYREAYETQDAAHTALNAHYQLPAYNLPYGHPDKETWRAQNDALTQERDAADLALHLAGVRLNLAAGFRAVEA